MGYLLDLVGLFWFSVALLLAIYKFTTLSSADVLRLFTQTPGADPLCDHRLVYFTFFAMVFYPTFLVFMTLLLCVGCFRNDYCRNHFIFREERQMAGQVLTGRRRYASVYSEIAALRELHKGAKTGSEGPPEK